MGFVGLHSLWCSLRWEHYSAQTLQTSSRPGDRDRAVADLAAEVHNLGFVAYTALTEHGDWDLFVMRPDGTVRTNITRTREFSEVGGRFSPDGARLLYYRMPKGEVLDNNKYGTYDLVVAKADGTEPIDLGDDFSWASWGSDGTQMVSLSRQGIRFIELGARSVIRKMDRHGFVEQLVWSPDGKWLVGTANGLGEQWAIGRIDASTGTINRVSDGDCFNCTPDWFPDSRRVIYSKGHPRTEGWRNSGWPRPMAGKSGCSAARSAAICMADPSHRTVTMSYSPDLRKILAKWTTRIQRWHSYVSRTHRLFTGKAISSATSTRRRRTAPCSTFRRAGNLIGPPARLSFPK